VICKTQLNGKKIIFLGAVSLAHYENDKVKMSPFFTPAQNDKEKLQHPPMHFPICLKSLRQLASSVSDVPSSSC